MNRLRVVLRPLLAVNPACPVPPVGARPGSADRETAAVGADPGGHPYRADGSPSASESRGVRRRTVRRWRGPSWPRRSTTCRRRACCSTAWTPTYRAAAHLRLGEAERGAERVGLLARLRRVLPHTVAPARARSIDREHPPRPIGGSPLPRLDGHRGPREAGPKRQGAPATQAQAGTAEARANNGRRSSNAWTGRRP